MPDSEQLKINHNENSLDASELKTEDDMQQRQLLEQRVDGERILADAQKQLLLHAKLLEGTDRVQMEAAIASLHAAMGGTDALRIKDAVHALDEAGKPFVERVMNEALSSALAGQSVEDY